METATFRTLIGDMALKYQNRRFVTCARTLRSLTYIELREKIDAMSLHLRALGLQKEDKVLLMMENSIEFAITYFGVTDTGAVVIPVNTYLKEAELSYLIKDSQAKAIITTGEFVETIPEKYREKQLSAEDGHIVLDIGLVPPAENTLQIPAAKPDLQPDDTAMMLYTSGTTGHPKGVILSYGNLLAKAEHIAAAHQLSEQDVALCVLPWFHINGLVITLITPLFSGGSIVIGGKFSVRNFWKDIEKYKTTWFSGVPTMYSHLLAKGIPEDVDFGSMRFARSASSPLPVAVLEEFERRCKMPIIESYGITEGCSQITTNPMPPLARKPGSVGITFGNEIKIVDSEMNELPAGALGEVLIRGNNITKGYFHKEEETKNAFTGEWFHSGDLGYLDEDGYLFLDGRIKELINRAGEKFSPREVDEVIYQMDGVELAATVGVPDAVYGEEVAAYIKVKEDSSLGKEDVISYCKERIASYKVPRMVFFVDDIPKGGNGKIQRLKLVEIFKKGQEHVSNQAQGVKG
ncbi:AMP-binding protein [uncultured Robinsoniella sp.]|uniref:AMP-binding protein n=1 Tax=uncultured Robinsoniella sp. TaxID=904190 RepID=UPI00374EB710